MKHHAFMVRLGLGAALAFAFIDANASAATIKIRVDDIAFYPPEVFAHPGDTIEWRNDDFVEHTATARDGQWDIALPIGAVRRLRLTQTGDLAYFCRYHPDMGGTIHVRRP